MKPPVFVIGLPRTGTTSMSAALRVLGWNPIDNPRHWDEMDCHDAASDAWVAAHWRELYAMVPGARFVLTTRGFDSWAQSLSRIPEFWRSPLYYDRYLRRRLFGTDDPTNVPSLRGAFHSHRNLIRTAIPADRLLVFPQPFRWEPLCEFLGVSVPDAPFPYLNRGGCQDVRINDAPA